MIDLSVTEFGYLKELLNSLDASLININEQIEEAGHCDSEHLFEEAEYFIGAGFCSMQRCLFAVLQDKDIEAAEARALGPKSTGGTPVAQLIHAAANYWKHSPEWHIWQLELSSHSQRTVNKLLNGKEYADYPLADLLFDLCKGKSLLLSHCLPYLEKWRSVVHEHLES